MGDYLDVNGKSALGSELSTACGIGGKQPRSCKFSIAELSASRICGFQWESPVAGFKISPFQQAVASIPPCGMK